MKALIFLSIIVVALLTTSYVTAYGNHHGYGYGNMNMHGNTYNNMYRMGYGYSSYNNQYGGMSSGRYNMMRMQGGM